MNENENVEKRSHHQPKAYRIDILFDIAFEACSNIYGNSKTDLLFSLLQTGKQVDVDKLKELPEYSKVFLIEKMISDLQEINQPIQQLRKLSEHERICKLEEYINSKIDVEKVTKPIKTLRIVPSYQNFIKEFSQQRLGEPIELSIANFIVNATDFEYDLIETVFKNLVDKEAEKI